MTDSSANQALLYGVLTDEILADLRQGRRPDTEALARRYPALSELISRHIEQLESIMRCGLGLPFTTNDLDKPDEIQLTLGDYRLVREIGRGGMGIVYEAEQLSLRRRVAVKVLPFTALIEPRRFQRFQNEAQAAAQLQHVSIVPIHAVGSDQGVHYYAMQFIEGRSAGVVVQAMRQSALRESEAGAVAMGMPSRSANAGAVTTPDQFRTIANWGIQVAEALHYAHELGIIHRDVKPANLLVDGNGKIWITDFGLARLRGQADLTATGELLGTQRYMSPEQALAKHELVDHRADIYGLGATLYELLTGEPVFPGHDRQEILGRIAFDEPRPLRRVQPGTPLDLETIVLKALAKSPAERYATAQEMADDLRRFLDDKPILARRPTIRERIVKWLRRHPAPAWASVAVLLVLVTALSISIFLIAQARNRAHDQQKLAQARRLDAIETVNKWYSEFGEQWLADQPQLEGKEREFVSAALVFFERLADDSDDDSRLQFERAVACRKVGCIHHKFAEPAKAEAAIRQAILLLGRLVDAHPNVAQYRAELAVAQSHYGSWLVHKSRHEEAKYQFAEALRFSNDTPLPADAPAIYRLTSPWVHHNLGVLHRDAGRSQEATKELAESRSQLEQIVAVYPSQPAYLEELARVYHDVGAVMFDSGADPLATREMFLKARDLFMKMPVSIRSSPLKQHLLGRIEQAIGALPTVITSDADDATIHSIRIFGKLADDFPSIPQYRLDVANVRGNYAIRLMNQGRHDLAAKELITAQSSLRSLVNDFPVEVAYVDALGVNRLNLAAVFAELQRVDEAMREGAEAVKTFELLANKHPEIPAFRQKGAMVHEIVAGLLWDTGRHSEAKRHFRQVLQLRTRLAEEMSATGPGDAASLAMFLVTCPDPSLCDPNESIRWAERGLALLRTNRDCWLAIGLAHCRAGRAQKALEALAEAQKNYNGGDAFEWFGLAQAYRHSGNALLANLYYAKARQWMELHNPRNMDLWRLRRQAAAALGLADAPPAPVPVASEKK